MEGYGEEGSDRHHSSWGPRRGIWQEGLEKALKTGTFLHGGTFTGNSKRWLKGGSGNGASPSMGIL
jgi:hypothetical protein